jgi:hypothetical protein
MPFYLPENSDYTIFDSALDSIRFTVGHTLVRGERTIWSKSSFVDERAEIMHWHDFGDLEGPGWAANAVGGAYEIHRLADFLGDAAARAFPGADLHATALGILDHVLDDGFIDRATGFIIGYRDLTHDRLCLNFKHHDNWLCPGSMAKVAYQLLVFSDLVDDRRAADMRAIAARTAEWIARRAPLADNGWYARRCTREGAPYHERAEGGPSTGSGQAQDPIFATSADGLFTVMLMTELTARGIADWRAQVRDKVDVFMGAGGIFGSINHDTYDQQENVAYSVAFRTLLRAGRLLGDPGVRRFAYQVCLAGLERFKMHEDRHGVATQGLLYMEDTWDTSYLWEDAEAALAYFEAHQDAGDPQHALDGLTILRAAAKHHHGQLGFLTEGVDWNNHVTAQHHFDGAEFGDIRYTEPFLNNQHIAEPTLFYLERLADKAVAPDGTTAYRDAEGNLVARV